MDRTHEFSRKSKLRNQWEYKRVSQKGSHRSANVLEMYENNDKYFEGGCKYVNNNISLLR